MEILVDITRDDFYHFHKTAMKILREYQYYSKKDQSRIWSILKWTGYWILIFIIMFMIMNLFKLDLKTIIIYSILLIITIRIISSQRIKNSIFDDGFILGSHHFIVEKDGIKEETTHSNSFTKWQGIMMVEEDKTNIYLFVDKCIAHIIPKRYFTSTTEKNKFLQTIQSHL